MDEKEKLKQLTNVLKSLESNKGSLTPEEFEKWNLSEARLTAEEADKWRKALAPSSLIEIIKQRPKEVATPLLLLGLTVFITSAYLGSSVSDDEAKKILSWLIEKLTKCKIK